MANLGLLVLVIITISQHASPMCAPDMKGRVCKDMMLPPELSNCIQRTHDNWPCHLSTKSTGHDKHDHNNIIDFLENELSEGHGGGGDGLLEVSGVVGGQVQQIKGCEGAVESPTTYPQDAIQGVPYVRYGHADQGQILLQASRLDGLAPVIEYRPPTPPSGVHRYQILLFQMSAGQDVHDLPDEQHRDSFDLNYFIGGNNLCEQLRAAFQYRVQHTAR